MSGIYQLRTLPEVQGQLVEVEERLELLRNELSQLAPTEGPDGLDGLESKLDIFDLLPGKLRPSLTGITER